MKSKISVHDRTTLTTEIAALAEATLADLKSRWRVLYGTEPPPRSDSGSRRRSFIDPLRAFSRDFVKGRWVRFQKDASSLPSASRSGKPAECVIPMSSNSR